MRDFQFWLYVLIAAIYVLTRFFKKPAQQPTDIPDFWGKAKAVRQWKFVPRKKQDGTPVSIRGKLPFYFEIDKDGKGKIKNPRQYR